VSRVVVVGCGPTGAVTALHLARRGYTVTILERSTFPRIKVCGDYLSAGATSRLRALRLPLDIAADARPIEEIVLHGFGTRLRLPLGELAGRSLPRQVLDARLADAARSAGAHVVHGVFLAAHEEEDRILVTFRDSHAKEHTIPAAALVGADGAWSSVARRTAMAPRTAPSGAWAVGGELEADDGAMSNTLEVFVGAGGYYARNPLPGPRINSMLVFGRPASGEHAEELVGRITGGRYAFNADRIVRKVAVGPLRYRARCVAQGRVVLAGDAAAFLDPFTGQGIATALDTAHLAASAAAALARGNPPPAVAAWYRRRWDQAVRPRRNVTTLVRALVRFPTLRRRALLAAADPAPAFAILLSAVTGARPAQDALTFRNLWSLLVA
jgi:flavin-dependent dehydrogenase